MKIKMKMEDWNPASSVVNTCPLGFGVWDLGFPGQGVKWARRGAGVADRDGLESRDPMPLREPQHIKTYRLMARQEVICVPPYRFAYRFLVKFGNLITTNSTFILTISANMGIKVFQKEASRPVSPKGGLPLTDPDLALLLRRCPDLPEPIRRAIMAMIEAF
jgi:hypothetical protein